MVFYVTPSGLIFSQLSSSSSSSDESASKNTASKKKQKTEAESPSQNSYLDAHVTSSNLSRDCLYLLKSFARSNSLNGRCGEIDLINLQGKSWVLDMRYNRTNGQAYIKRGWRNFCYENGLEAGSFYRFKFVLNETRPSLLLCSDSNCSKPSSEGLDLESASMKQNKFLIMTFKPCMLTSGHLYFPRTFVRDNEIKEGEEISLVDKDGVKWPSYVACSNDKERLYMAKGWKSFCIANKLMSGEPFQLEFVRGETKTPMIKFCSKGKVKVKQASEDEEATETWFQKREARCNRRSNKTSVDPKNLQCKKPVQSFSDHVKKSILETLIGVKRFRSELKIKERNLEASLKDIDALGERVLEINKIFK